MTASKPSALSRFLRRLMMSWSIERRVRSSARITFGTQGVKTRCGALMYHVGWKLDGSKTVRCFQPFCLVEKPAAIDNNGLARHEIAVRRGKID